MRKTNKKRLAKQNSAGTKRAGKLKTETVLGKSGHIDPKWARHYRVLTSLRDSLLQKRGERFKDVAQPIEPHSMDLADSGTDEFDHELALSQLASEQDGLFEIEEAMKRILTGTYGICEATGEPIAAARLRAIPWTRFSMEAEERLENEGGLPRRRLGQLGSVSRNVTGKLAESEPEQPNGSPPPEDETLHESYVSGLKHQSRRTRGQS